MKRIDRAIFRATLAERIERNRRRLLSWGLVEQSWWPRMQLAILRAVAADEIDWHTSMREDIEAKGKR